MTNEELLTALQTTGTGEAKLEIARLALRNHKLEPGELVALMSEVSSDTGRAFWPEGTCDKARQLLGGADPHSFAGKPPPMGKEASEERLGRIIAEQIGKTLRDMRERSEEKQAEAQHLSIGNPVKVAEEKAPTPSRIDTPSHVERSPGISHAKAPEPEKGPGIHPARPGKAERPKE